MARPKKKGLDYFPLDIDVFEDEKVIDLSNTYGPLGEVIYMRCLCLIYKHGYYYQFESLEKLAAMLIKSVGNRWTRDKKSVVEVILYLAKINLLSAELMQRNVLTSHGIQERYLTAVGRRQIIINEYNLLEKNSDQEAVISASKNQVSATVSRVNVTETPVSVCNNSTKEIKENKSILCASSARIDYHEVQALFNSICKSLTPLNDLTIPQIRLLQQAGINLKNNGLTFEEYFKRVEKSEFLTGKSGTSSFKADFNWILKPENMQKVLTGNYDVSYGKSKPVSSNHWENVTDEDARRMEADFLNALK